MQRAILDALKRPLIEGGPYATAATNRQIADEVHLSVDAVKGHLRALYARLGLEDLPQNAKRARLAEIGISGAVDESLPARPPEAPVIAAPQRSQRGRLPAMLSAVALGLVLLGVVVGLMLGHDGATTIISQEPGTDEPGNAGQGRGGKGTLLGGLPGPWSDDGLFAAGPTVPAGYELSPGSAGAAPVSKRTGRARKDGDRASVKGDRGGSSSPTRAPAGASKPSNPAPAVTTTAAPTQRQSRRTCTTRRHVTYRPVTVTVRRVRLRPHRVRVRVVTYRKEVRMVPMTRQVPNKPGNGNGGNGNGNGNGKKKNKNGQGNNQGAGTHTETYYVRQVRRVPVVKYVTRIRQRREVRYVKVTRRQRVVRMVRSCRRA